MAYRLFDKFMLIGLVAIGFLACENFSSSDGEADGDDAAGFSVTYDANGAASGSVPVDSLRYAAGQTVSVKPNSGLLAKAGFSFGGWNTQADGNGTTYSAGQTFAMGGANVTLYAKWKESLTALWARSVRSGDATSRFHAVTTDSSGNAYCAGDLWGDAEFDFGGATVKGAYSGGSNAAIVKYDSSGNAVRARSVSEGADNSRFSGVAIVPGGDVFAVGDQTGSSSYTYGTGVSATGYNTNEHSVVVKYLR